MVAVIACPLASNILFYRISPHLRWGRHGVLCWRIKVRGDVSFFGRHNVSPILLFFILAIAVRRKMNMRFIEVFRTVHKRNPQSPSLTQAHYKCKGGLYFCIRVRLRKPNPVTFVGRSSRRTRHAFERSRPTGWLVAVEFSIKICRRFSSYHAISLRFRHFSLNL